MKLLCTFVVVDRTRHTPTHTHTHPHTHTHTHTHTYKTLGEVLSRPLDCIHVRIPVVISYLSFAKWYREKLRQGCTISALFLTAAYESTVISRYQV